MSDPMRLDAREATACRHTSVRCSTSGVEKHSIKSSLLRDHPLFRCHMTLPHVPQPCHPTEKSDRSDNTFHSPNYTRHISRAHPTRQHPTPHNASLKHVQRPHQHSTRFAAPQGPAPTTEVSLTRCQPRPSSAPTRRTDSYSITSRFALRRGRVPRLVAHTAASCGLRTMARLRPGKCRCVRLRGG